MKEKTLLADNTMAAWIVKEGCTSLLNVDRRTAVMLLFLAKCGRGSDLVLAIVGCAQAFNNSAYDAVARMSIHPVKSDS